MKHKLGLLLGVVVLLTACGPVILVPSPTIAPTESWTLVETAVPTTPNVLLTELDTPANETISTLQHRLQTQEADTFAGLWLQHEPAYRIIVAFTRNGAETLQRYVVAGSELAQLIDIQSVEYSYAQLEADQQAVSRLLESIQHPADVGILITVNRVVVETTDQAALDAALAAVHVTLPPSVVVNAIDEPVGENAP